MIRFNSIELNQNLDPIGRHNKIYEIESTLFVNLDLWVSLINWFERIKGLGQ